MEYGGHAVCRLAKGHHARRSNKRMGHFPGHEHAALKFQFRQHGVAHVDCRHGLMENLLRQLLAVRIVRLGQG